MDRIMVYPGQVPLETDVLNTNKFAMLGLAKLAEAVLGTGPVLQGLAATPGTGLNVQVAAGQIYQLATVDAVAYSSLAADTTHQVLKQGFTLDPVTLSVPAPGTAGKSINYLIQVAYQEADTGAAVLQYWNSSNPTLPFSGPGGSGGSSLTVRSGQCVVQVKAGTAATTGTQTTPAPDSGFVSAYVVTVAYGAVSISAGNIAAASGAPFMSGTLPNAALRNATNTFTQTQTFSVAPVVPNATSSTNAAAAGQVQSNALAYGVDTGTANVYTVSYVPSVISRTDGMILTFKAKFANTGAATFSPNGLAASPIYGSAHQPLQGGEITANGDVEVIWNSTLNGGSGAWVLFDATGGALQVGPGTQSQHAVTLGQAQALITGAVVTYVNSSQAVGAGSYQVDTTAGSFTLTLPATPATGLAITFEDAANTWGTNNWTLSRNGNTIAGNASDLTVNLADQKFTIWYNGSDWRFR